MKALTIDYAEIDNIGLPVRYGFANKNFLSEGIYNCAVSDINSTLAIVKPLSLNPSSQCIITNDPPVSRSLDTFDIFGDQPSWIDSAPDNTYLKYDDETGTYMYMKRADSAAAEWAPFAYGAQYVEGVTGCYRTIDIKSKASFSFSANGSNLVAHSPNYGGGSTKVKEYEAKLITNLQKPDGSYEKNEGITGLRYTIADYEKYYNTDEIIWDQDVHPSIDANGEIIIGDTSSSQIKILNGTHIITIPRKQGNPVFNALIDFIGMNAFAFTETAIIEDQEVEGTVKVNSDYTMTANSDAINEVTFKQNDPGSLYGTVIDISTLVSSTDSNIAIKPKDIYNYEYTGNTIDIRYEVSYIKAPTDTIELTGWLTSDKFVTSERCSITHGTLPTTYTFTGSDFTGATVAIVSYTPRVRSNWILFQGTQYYSVGSLLSYSDKKFTRKYNSKNSRFSEDSNKEDLTFTVTSTRSSINPVLVINSSNSWVSGSSTRVDSSQVILYDGYYYAKDTTTANTMNKYYTGSSKIAGANSLANPIKYTEHTLSFKIPGNWATWEVPDSETGGEWVRGSTYVTVDVTVTLCLTWNSATSASASIKSANTDGWSYSNIKVARVDSVAAGVVVPLTFGTNAISAEKAFMPRKSYQTGSGETKYHDYITKADGVISPIYLSNLFQ